MVGITYTEEAWAVGLILVLVALAITTVVGAWVSSWLAELAKRETMTFHARTHDLPRSVAPSSDDWVAMDAARRLGDQTPLGGSSGLLNSRGAVR